MLIQLPGGTAIDPFGETIVAQDNGDIHLHTPTALGRLLERWKAETHPNLAGLLASYTDAAQDVENVIWDIFVARLIDYASFAQLDTIGAIVGEPRNGLGDAAYRARIKARILINQSFGRASDIIHVLQAVDAALFTLTELYPAAFRIDYATPPANDSVAGQIPGIVAQTRAAGVRASVVIPADLTRGARWGTVQSVPADTRNHWGSVTSPSTGGLFAHQALA